MAIIISPEPGRHKEIGQLLLSLADHPQQVQWVTWPQAGYEVSEELFGKFAAETVDTEAPQPQPETPKRRRARPRKEDSTDNDTGEEE